MVGQSCAAFLITGFPLLESFLDRYETDMVGCETVKCRQRASKGPRVALESTCFPSPTGACMGWSLFFLKLGSSWPVKFGLRPEVLATAVARVNIKPTTAFCTISQEISQWISTATGNNGSQLQQPVVTLDIPVASGPMLSVEMRKSLTLCYRCAWGQSSWATTSNDLSAQLPPPLAQVASGWAHYLLIVWKGYIGRLAGRPMKSLGTWRIWCKGTHSWFTQSSSHLLKENLGVFFQNGEYVARWFKCSEMCLFSHTYLQISLNHWPEC